jgi:hypothetical protein
MEKSSVFFMYVQNCQVKRILSCRCTQVHIVALDQVPGTDVMILKIFSPKKIAKKLAVFLTKTKLNYAKF